MQNEIQGIWFHSSCRLCCDDITWGHHEKYVGKSILILLFRLQKYFWNSKNKSHTIHSQFKWMAIDIIWAFIIVAVITLSLGLLWFWWANWLCSRCKSYATWYTRTRNSIRQTCARWFGSRDYLSGKRCKNYTPNFQGLCRSLDGEGFIH